MKYTSVDFKTKLGIAFIMFMTHCPLAWNILIVSIMALLDIGFGLWKIKVTGENFNIWRLLQGFAKIIVYSALLGVAFVIDEHILNIDKIKNEGYVLRSLTACFVYLEVVSINKKRVACGKVSLLEVLRTAIKVIKELVTDFKEITR